MTYRILYVEDEQILGQLVRETLQKQQYEVVQVINGIDALKAWKEMKPHLCLLDIMLPGKDGYEVARQIRALDSEVPIIFLTAKIQVHDVVAGFRSGANDYIRKPFSTDELLARMDSWLREKYGLRKRNEPNEFIAGECRFLPKEQLLITHDTRITLTFKEAVILDTLFVHRNQVVGRNYLMQKVWNSETIYNSRSLDVYINRLRKYFSGSNNKILTLKGVGYKFIAE